MHDRVHCFLYASIPSLALMQVRSDCWHHRIAAAHVAEHSWKAQVGAWMDSTDNVLSVILTDLVLHALRYDPWKSPDGDKCVLVSVQS